VIQTIQLRVIPERRNACVCKKFGWADGTVKEKKKLVHIWPSLEAAIESERVRCANLRIAPLYEFRYRPAVPKDSTPVKP